MRGVVISRTRSDYGLTTTVFVKDSRGEFKQVRLVDRFGAALSLNEFHEPEFVSRYWQRRRIFELLEVFSSEHKAGCMIVHPRSIRLCHEDMYGTDFRILVEKFTVDEFEELLPKMKRSRSREAFVTRNDESVSMGFVRCVEVVVESNKSVRLFTNNRPPVKALITCENMLQSMREKTIHEGMFFHNVLVRFELGPVEWFYSKGIFRRCIQCAGIVF